MPTPAFEPYYQALVTLGRAGRTAEIAALTGRKSDSVSNAFGYHLRLCRERGVVPSVVKIQNGVYAINEANKPANPKHHNKPEPKAKATPTTEESRLFEQFAVTKGGTILVRDEDGTIYKLEELDF